MQIGVTARQIEVVLLHGIVCSLARPELTLDAGANTTTRTLCRHRLKRNQVVRTSLLSGEAETVSTR